MNTQKLPLVNFEQAKSLKQAGFDWQCTNCYFYDLDNPSEKDDPKNWSEDIGDMSNWNSWVNHAELYTSRPTVAIALRWLREVKGIYVAVHVEADENKIIHHAILFTDLNTKFNYTVSKYKSVHTEIMRDENEQLTIFESVDQAESAALSKALTILN